MRSVQSSILKIANNYNIRDFYLLNSKFCCTFAVESTLEGKYVSKSVS